MRCAVCNGHGYRRVEPAEAASRSDCPPRVLELLDQFFACKSCDKLYWEGPKSNNAFGHFTSLFEGLPDLHVGNKADAKLYWEGGGA